MVLMFKCDLKIYFHIATSEETVFAFKKAERYSVCNSARATSRDFGAFWACLVCAAPFPSAEGKNSCQPVCQPAARLR